MFKRKLTALNYHGSEGFKLNEESFKSMVVWLEDQRIRHYPIETRSSLRKTDSAEWTSALNKYLKDLNCPYGIEDKHAVVDWLLGYAIRLEYSDSEDKYKSVTSAKVKEETTSPQMVPGNLLDNLDFQSAEFKAGVSSLARALNINQHPDHLVTLNGICKFVTTRFTKEPSMISAEAKPFPLKDNVLGFETGDYVLNEAAKILRLLYIHDIRDLQTKINEAIVAVQSITADPRTDTKLGRVGK